MRARRHDRFRLEWPTLAAVAGCYLVWGGALLGQELLGWLWIIPAILAVTFHSSLQHEVLHGHPTGSAALNEALILPAIGLFIPYRRYRSLHLKHHHDERLTDPYDDPESWYLTSSTWRRMPKPIRLLLRLNATLAGRIVLGPALSLFAFWSSELSLIRRGDRAARHAWLCHIAGTLPVLAVISASGLNPLLYAVIIAYPGMSVLLIRSFIEHRAARRVSERTAVVEAGPLMSLLFLNNNLHAIHHRYPALAWYRLPERWRAERAKTLLDNNGYFFKGGYIEVAGRWLFAEREPVVHPLDPVNPVLDDGLASDGPPAAAGSLVMARSTGLAATSPPPSSAHAPDVGTRSGRR